MQGRWLSGVAVAALALVAGLGLLAPAASRAATTDASGYYGSFRVDASNGYELVGLVGADPDRGPILRMEVSRPGSSATYTVPAAVTATTLEADLGELGGVSLVRVATGRTRTVAFGCEEPVRVQVETARFEGVIEFHGEEGYAEALATGAPVDFSAYRRILCIETASPHVRRLPHGAQMAVLWRKGRGVAWEFMSAVRFGPGSRSRLVAGIAEQRGPIEISRTVDVWADPGAFEFDPKLRRATLRPPAPFSGHASFHRFASPGNRWHSRLAVDFPGRADHPLTRPEPAVSLSRRTLGFLR